MCKQSVTNSHTRCTSFVMWKWIKANLRYISGKSCGHFLTLKCLKTYDKDAACNRFHVVPFFKSKDEKLKPLNKQPNLNRLLCLWNTYSGGAMCSVDTADPGHLIERSWATTANNVQSCPPNSSHCRSPSWYIVQNWTEQGGEEWGVDQYGGRHQGWEGGGYWQQQFCWYAIIELLSEGMEAFLGLYPPT